MEAQHRKIQDALGRLVEPWEDMSIEERLDCSLLCDCVAIQRDEFDQMNAEARRFYQADGSFIELEPAEVITRRKAAAVTMREMLAALERVTVNAVCSCADGGPGFVCDTCEARAVIKKARG